MLAGVGHVRRFGHLHAVLVSQALLPYRWLRSVAWALVVAEVTVGFAAVVAVPISVYKASAAFAVEAGLFVALLVYAGILRAFRPTAPCGCFADHGPATVPALIRTGVLALGASAAAAVTAEPTAHAVTPLLAAGAVVTAVVAYAAPIAFRPTTNYEETTWRP